MKNKKFYPFSRNHYYYSKLLTVRDFEDEQRYMNDKRRIGNLLTGGAGVLSGLSLLIIDEKTISVEAGVAYDYLGREIVVDTSFSKRLNVIEGFDTIENPDSVYVALAYDEQLDEQAHAIAASDQNEQSFNRVKETYRLFVTDTAPGAETLTLNYLREDSQVIYEANGVRITQTVPRYVEMHDKLWIQVKIEKINVPHILKASYDLDLRGFKTLTGDTRLTVQYSDRDIAANTEKTLVFCVIPEETKNTTCEILVASDGGKLEIGTESLPLQGGSRFSTTIIEGDVGEHILAKYYATPFEEMVRGNAECPIYLARLRLIQKGSEYSIEHMEELPFKQRILSNAVLTLLFESAAKRIKRVSQEPYEHIPPMSPPPVVTPKSGSAASGTETIELDARSAKRSFFSDEIAHGLGKGDVFIRAGIEDTVENSIFEQQKTVFGDAGVFLGSEYETNLPPFSIGIVSYTEKGTFKIGVKPAGDTPRTAVTVKWWAYKAENPKASNEAEMNNVSIVLTPNTATVSLRERVKFTARVLGTDDQECRFSVGERDGGKMEAGGVYEAPAREGVYTVIAESIKYPSIKATAYVIVKNK